MVLEGIGIAALAGWLLDACGDGADLPPATTSTCSGGTCIDLTDAANATLTQVGGTMAFDADGDTILVARTSATEVIALSAVCTHAGCIVDYSATTGNVECECHGSEFATDGSVLRGPADRPLKMYAATLSGTTITITT
ncbi:MAG TPA: Rieske (2Fe-2S) protein [Kofleriaceae bacterium]|nr:Rieske (2Fe-2S) protein [Kofleriaceae bacterium]